MGRVIVTAGLLLAACGGMPEGEGGASLPCSAPWDDCEGGADTGGARVALCRIEGTLETEAINIALGDESFAVFFDDPTPVSVTVGESAPAQIRVVGEHLVIQSPGSVPLRVADRTSTARGMVGLSDRLALDDVRIVGGRLLASAQLGYGVSVAALPIACAQVAAGDPRDWLGDDKVGGGVKEEWPVVEEGQLARARAEELKLHAAPRAGYPVDLQIEKEVVRFDVLAQEPDWVEIGWQGIADQSSVRGWVPAASVEVLPNEGMMFGGGTSCGISCCGVGLHGRATTRRTTALMPGTPIHASADGPAWAEITAVVVVEIEETAGEAWSRVVALPGLHERGCDRNHAWVANSGLP